MQTRITLVCHATTRDLRAVTFGGDDGLDDVGQRRAAALAGALERVERAWTSPALRARQTAEALGFAAVADERLRDCDYGRWAGLKFQQVLLKEPRKLVSWVRNPSGAPHGGETIPELIRRTAEWLDGRMKDKGHTVAVTHASVIRAAIVHVMGADVSSFWRVDVTPLFLTDLRTNGRRWVLRALTPLEAPAGDDEAAGKPTALAPVVGASVAPSAQGQR